MQKGSFKKQQANNSRKEEIMQDDMLSEGFDKRYSDANLDTLYELVKANHMFHMYKQIIGTNSTQNSSTAYLEMITLLGLKDEDKQILTKVALDIVFSMLDTKFRNEIKE